jgi:uncharacterized protein (TIRG00374 family)
VETLPVAELQDPSAGLTPRRLWEAALAFLRAPAHSPSGILRRRLSLAAKLLVTIGAFLFVASLADVGEAVALMRTQNLWLVLLAAVAILLQIGLGSLRWRAVLIASAQQDSANISPWLAFRLYYASIFFNSILPGTFGGDVVRVISTRTLGVTTGASVHSVVLDRALTLVMLLVMALPAAPRVWGGIGIGMSGALLGVGVGFVAALFAFYMLSRIPRLAVLKQYVDRVIQSFWRALANLLSHPRPLLMAVPLALATHASYCIAAFLLAQSLGINLALIDALTLMPLVLLVATIPISVGGWGVREVGAIGLLGLVGISSHEAVIISLQFGVISVLMSLPGALFWIAVRRGPGPP